MIEKASHSTCKMNTMQLSPIDDSNASCCIAVETIESLNLLLFSFRSLVDGACWFVKMVLNLGLRRRQVFLAVNETELLFLLF